MSSGHKKALKDYSPRAFCFGKRNRAFFFRPDYTVGTGIPPVQSPDFTVPGFAGYNRRSGIAGTSPAHPALKILIKYTAEMKNSQYAGST
jgi:hypothetical protein